MITTKYYLLLEYFTSFQYSRDWGHCLNDEPSAPEFEFPVLPPGVMYDVHHQCRLQYGPDAQFCYGIDVSTSRMSHAWYMRILAENYKTNSEFTDHLIGLSKERPILGDHPKAHILEIRRISHEIWRISGEIWWISCRFQVKSSRFHADFT